MSADSSSPRPQSAVSTGVGIAGLVGLLIWMSISISLGLSGSYWALANVAACGLPMVFWSLMVDRVHRNPTTGLDWVMPPRTLRDVADVSLTKLAGLWATWAAIAATYCIFRFYWRDNYLFAMEVFSLAAGPLFVLSIPYVFWIDRRLAEPRDGAWHLGALLTGQAGVDRTAIAEHLRAWAVKGFFLAFMVSIVPGGFRNVVLADFGMIQDNPVALANWLITLMFVIDVAFATVGYMLTMKPLDAHIRSATPYAAGWAAALICYPPFILMNAGGPLDYRPASADWLYWLQGHPILMTMTGVVLVALTAIYAWATVAFGLRFSNLTDRGILTHGPYAFTKHPAYLSKNLFWWVAGLPFLVTSGSVIDVLRNTALLAVVSCVYYWRAKTEEWHLGTDADYRAYTDWMAEHALITRWLTPRTWRRGKSGEPPAAQPAEQDQAVFSKATLISSATSSETKGMP
jgi:protein-S-isoprenylcysteine O-methyltransferase Ste14